MRISQKISLSFAVIFLLVFALGGTAVFSLRQIYKGVYESLRQDVPSIHESAVLGIQIGQVQKDLHSYLAEGNSRFWDQYLHSSESAKEIIIRFSSYLISPEERALLKKVEDVYQKMEQSCEAVKSYPKEWKEKHQRFLEKRDTVIQEIALLAEWEEKRLETEADLFIVQSHYLPVLSHLANFRKRTGDLASAVERKMIAGADQPEETLIQELPLELKRLQVILDNYVLVPEEQTRHMLLKQESRSFLKASEEVLAVYNFFSNSVKEIGDRQYEIRELLIQLIEQERGQVARKTGMGITFIEDIPATRFASTLGIDATNTQVALEHYLLTSNERDHQQYEQLRMETQKSLEEYSKSFPHRQATGHRQEVLLKELDQITHTLWKQDQQILTLHKEQQNLLQELQKLLFDFGKETDELISGEIEATTQKKDVFFAQEGAFPKIQLTTSILDSVSDSFNLLTQYPLIKDVKIKEQYDIKLLEILQNLDRLKTMFLERNSVEGLGHLFQKIRMAANDLIETSDHLQSSIQNNQILVSSLQKNLLEVIGEEKEKNLTARDQLENKITLINGLIIGIVLIIIVLGIAVIIYTSRAITKPIQELSQGVKIIAAGELSYRIPLQTGDELEDLAREFNKMTRELQGLYNNLELKVEQRTRELAQANASLEESNRELDDFTYIVSHDLKEPLRGINAFSRFLLEDYADRFDAKGKEYLTAIVGASKRMTQLIEDLLDLSRITRQHHSMGKTDLNQVLEEVRKNLVYALNEQQVILRVESLPTLVCDRVRLQQVFHNLISNGIKYNDKIPPIIEVGYVKKDSIYQFYVRDNGIGIPREHLDKVFKLFHRLPGTEKIEGTGAGLTIVKKIVEKHQGKIWLESNSESGTTFYFTLPEEQPI